uniref:Hepcidin n=1 Tax=Kryptolebias marmoratus TaxID=37003 RepID=A0A3Q3ESE5_KRYMA
MNSFTVAVAVAVMLTSICLQESSAVPLTEVTHELVEAMTDDSPVAAHEEIPEESWNMPYEAMEMRRRRRRCRFCCGCCPNMVGCGTCCKF